MKYRLSEKINDLSSCDSLVIAVDSDQKLILDGIALPKPYLKFIASILNRDDLDTSLGSTLLIHSELEIQRIILVRADKANLTAVQYGKLLTSAYTALRKTKSHKALSLLAAVNAEQLSLEEKLTKNVIACGETGYQYSRKKDQKALPLSHLSFLCKKPSKSCEQAINIGEASNLGITLAKELGNLPPNICTPNLMAKEAEKLGKQYKHLRVTILNEVEMKKLGMNALLAVSQGSAEPAKFIVMNYQRAAKTVKPLVLVGKGVTFDTGGISLKPPMNMPAMKYDMLGAASVLGAMKAICELSPTRNIIGITPCVENMPDGAAGRPADVVTSMAGIDIEILNTDAEGRLILCDALCYAKKFKPAAVIDLATLTGAAVAALGHYAQPIMGNNQDLIDDILKTFNKLGERTWQLPLYEEYGQDMKSKVADIANIATSNRGLAGASQAGVFLSRFTEDYPWAHLDIAGTAFTDGELATGRPVAALIQFALNYKAH